MIGDFAIAFLAIASGLSAYKLFTLKTENKATAICFALVLASFLFGGIIVPNLGLLSGLFTPEINGVLIDAETLKPVPNVDVVVGWSCDYLESPYHSGENHVQSIHVKSDSNGQFYAPSRYKSLAIKALSLYSRENSKSHISIFSLDYHVINSARNKSTETLMLKRITTYKELEDQYKQIEYRGHNGNKDQKALVRIYKDMFPQKRKEFEVKYGIPKDSLYMTRGI